MSGVRQVSRASRRGAYSDWCELSKMGEWGEYRKLSHHHNSFDILHVFKKNQNQ